MNLLMISGDASVARGQPGAFEAMLRHFAAYWDRIDILTPGGGGTAPRTLHDHVHVWPSPYPKLLQPVFVLRQGRALLAERPYALITSHDYGRFAHCPVAWMLSRRSGGPYVSELHHIEGYPRAVTWRERRSRWLARRYVTWASGRAAAFRVVNQVEMPELLRQWGVPDDKILVLPSLYLDYDVFRPLPETPRDYDVLFVGRLASNKGLFTLLDALALVRRTHPAVRLGLRGDGPLRSALEARITALGLGGNVVWIPRAAGPEGLAEVYNRAGMLVCASTAEGGPRVTIEAMACGVPVISTPVGVMRELLRDGENGLRTGFAAPDLAAAITRLLEDADLRARLGEAGRRSVQDFDAAATIRRYAEGYQALIARLRAG